MSLKSLSEIEQKYGSLVVSYIKATGTAKHFHDGQWIIFILRPQRFSLERMVDMFILPQHPNFPEGWTRAGYELITKAKKYGLLPKYQRLRVISTLWALTDELNQRQRQDHHADQAAGLTQEVLAKRNRDRFEVMWNTMSELENFVKKYNHDDLAEIDQGEGEPPTGWRWFLRLLRLA